MGFDQQNGTIIRVRKNQSGLWDVCEAGFDLPIASFETERDAENYARDLVDAQPGAKLEN